MLAIIYYGVIVWTLREVDDFLDEIMEDYETHYKELAVLRPKVEELEAALERYKNIPIRDGIRNPLW